MRSWSSDAEAGVGWAPMNHHRCDDSNRYLSRCILPVQWTHGRQSASREAGRQLKDSQEPRTRLCSPDWQSSRSSRRAVPSPRGWPSGHAVTRPWHTTRACSGGAHPRFQNHSGRRPGGPIMVCTRRAVSELSCYTSTYLQNMGPESLTTAAGPTALCLHSTPQRLSLHNLHAAYLPQSSPSD